MSSQDKNSARLSCYYEIIYVCVNIYGGKGLNLKNFSLDTNIYIYIYTLDEFVYRIIVRDFEKWRLEVSFGSFDRKRAERERERLGSCFGRTPVTTAALRSSELRVSKLFEQVSSRSFYYEIDINRV